MSTKHKKLIVVVCHDAGGAEVVGAYIQSRPASEVYHCFVAGPAAKIFKRRGIPATRIAAHSSDEKLKKIIAHVAPALVLTGTGWATSLEVSAIRAGNALNIPTTAYIDHWVNYRERFGFPHTGWKKNLPAAIWVGDAAGLRLAKQYFSVPVKLKPNQYFKEIKQSYQAVQKKFVKSHAILWVCEPVLAPKNFYGDEANYVPHESRQLDSFLCTLTEVDIQVPVIVRRHPAEPREKYTNLIKKHADAITFLESHPPLVEDIARATWVVGVSSMALAIASLCQKKVMSTLTPRQLRALLPISSISAEYSPVRAARRIVV